MTTRLSGVGRPERTLPSLSTDQSGGIVFLRLSQFASGPMAIVSPSSPLDCHVKKGPVRVKAEPPTDKMYMTYPNPAMSISKKTVPP